MYFFLFIMLFFRIKMLIFSFLSHICSIFKGNNTDRFFYFFQSTFLKSCSVKIFKYTVYLTFILRQLFSRLNYQSKLIFFKILSIEPIVGVTIMLLFLNCIVYLFKFLLRFYLMYIFMVFSNKLHQM